MLNFKYLFITDFYVIFFWTVYVGAMEGTSYTNFLFLAVTSTTLSCDMKLNYSERELVVNMLLLAQDLGGFFATFLCFAIQMYNNPQVIYNPPG
jgi:hypothetical protein